MALKTILIKLIRSLISAFLFSIIFLSIVDFDAKETINTAFSEIYNHANKETQTDTLVYLSDFCNSMLSNQESAFLFQELCVDQEKRKEVEKNCNDFYLSGIKDPEVEKSCNLVMSGELDEICAQTKGKLEIDKQGIKQICTDHKNNEITDNQFFVNMMTHNIKDPGQNIMSLYTPDTYLIPIIITLLILIALFIFLLHKEIPSLIANFGKILITISILMIISFIIPNYFEFFFPLDTSNLLHSLTHSTDPQIMFKSLPVIFLLITKYVFTITFFIIGILLLTLGILFRVYAKKLAKQ